MKKSELQQIIREEVQTILNEGNLMNNPIKDLLKETELVPKTKYTLKDNEFSTIRSVRFVGQFEKMGAKYYKFIDLETNKSFNLNLDFQKDYTITPNN